MNDEWTGKKVLVVGLGDTGLSTLRFLARREAIVRAADSRASPPTLGTLRAEFPRLDTALGAFDPVLLEGVDAVVASPGVALREPLLREAARKGIEVVGDVEVFARALRKRAAGTRVLGITGTNGKSTVTALAGAMGEAAGLRTVVAGNIGLPVLDAIDSPEGERAQLFVLELSSYQLETTSSLAFHAATLLNVTQDHLDRYDGMADYARAKERIFMHCRTRVVNRDDAWSRALANAGAYSFGLGEPTSQNEWGLDEKVTRLMRGGEALIALDEMAMQGLHNAANALAAHALLSAIDASADALAQALRTFKGLPHRVELVAETHGIRFYDDSKGTNVGATVAALEGMREPVVLIAGGDGKGQDFAPLEAAVAAKARAVVLIGRDGPAIARALAGNGVPLERADSMERAVEIAFELAREGDAVLLSPACASFDMFHDYKHRGDAFAQAARAIAERTTH
jgi:UDP-N-acetylmuramoylalanine--D-glutamate ligase